MTRFLVTLIIAITLVSCEKSPIGVKVSKYKPILINKNSLPNSVLSLPPSDLANPGKYLINGNYLYVIEKYIGVHVYDNTNTSSPQNIKFISIPGIEMISVMNNTLFADNSTDIVALDISNPANPVLISRMPNILPQPGTPDGLPLDAPVAQSSWPANTVVVNWVKIID